MASSPGRGGTRLAAPALMVDVSPPSKPWDAIRVGDLEVRLAASAAEIDAAQALRYRVFYEEMQAEPTPAVAARRRDFDPFDDVCDHLLVLDHARPGDPVVGTYRLLRRSVADRLARAFYTASEYDITKILAQPGELLELGRSCVDASYRNRATMQLLWRGIAAYVLGNEITLMFGCASFPGTDPDAHALPLSYLYHFHLAPEALRPRTLPDRYVAMDRMPKEQIAPRAALLSLPPLIKGYLRLGGFVGDGAFIDREFNTTDVCIIVKTDLVTAKYRERLT